jgi:hypothetical protein
MWHGVGRTSEAYEPRDPAASALYQVVREHVETFRVQAARLRDGEGLPRFVDDEFRAFLNCGFLAGGFARLRCADCRAERLVAFSCKGRGFCPSCGGRRMAERAAHLVDHVLPDVPIRQWVLTLPHRWRYRLAWDHDGCRAVTALFVRAVLAFLRQRARERGVSAGRGGAVVILQRFGGALNLNVHLHALVLDGVFASEHGRVRFHPLPALTTADVADVLATVVPRLAAWQARRGVTGHDDADAWSDAAPTLAGLAAASVQGVAALGRAAGTRAQRLGRMTSTADPRALAAWQARQEGFDLHAGVRVGAGRRERLERVCHYVLRPPVSQDRLTVTQAGHVRLALRHTWSDGTTHLEFEPVAFLERLAVLVPRPRVNLILYHGVLAPRAAWRSAIVPRGAPPPDDAAGQAGGTSGWRWAALMRRTLGFDVLACSRCGGRLRLIAVIEQAPVIQRILRHLGLPDTVPAAQPPRAPPWLYEADQASACDGVDPVW